MSVTEKMREGGGEKRERERKENNYNKSKAYGQCWLCVTGNEAHADIP